jgi:hypothetical protein
MRFAATAVLLALLPAPSPAQRRTVDTFCIELRRVVHATGETPPFASLASARGTLPGFGDCTLFNDRHGRRFSCTARAEPALFQQLVDQVARCLTGAIRRPDEAGLPLVQFRTATALIAIRQYPLHGDGSGVPLSFSVLPIPIH